MEEFGKLEERVVLVGVQTDDHDNVEESLDELKELASTAGAVTVGRIIQNRESVHPGTYIGKGKIQEVKELVEKYEKRYQEFRQIYPALKPVFPHIQ